MYCQHKADKTKCPNYKKENPNDSEQTQPPALKAEEANKPQPKDEAIPQKQDETNQHFAGNVKGGQSADVILQAGGSGSSNEDINEQTTKGATGEKQDSEEEQEYVVGPGRPPRDKMFAKDRQPSPEAKKNGWKKKKFTRDTIRAMLELPATIPEKMREELVEIYGEEVVASITNGQLMTLKQMHKAIKNGDTAAFTAVIDQGIGRPVQGVAQTDMSGNDLPGIRVALPAGMKLDFPSTTEGDEKRSDKKS